MKGTSALNIPAKIIDYAHPPIVEVVFGVQFDESDFPAPSVGTLWSTAWREFEQYVESPRIPANNEIFDESPSIQLTFSSKPPTPRMCFTTSDGHRVIQVQSDRFHYNRKRHRIDDASDPYVGFPQAFDEFKQRYSELASAVADSRHAPLRPNQYELTYVNVMPASDKWSALGDVGALVPDFSWRTGERFLPTPEVLNWSMSFRLPNNQGRLHVAMNSGKHRDTGEPVLQAIMTARGAPNTSDDDARDAWFALAREWIVRGFADLTSDDYQQHVWGRIHP